MKRGVVTEMATIVLRVRARGTDSEACGWLLMREEKKGGGGEGSLKAETKPRGQGSRRSSGTAWAWHGMAWHGTIRLTDLIDRLMAFREDEDHTTNFSNTHLISSTV